MRGDRRRGRMELVLVGDLPGGPEDHDGPIVHRMVEGAPRHHQSVDDGGHDADLGAGAERLPRARGGGAVQVDRVADPGVDRGEAARGAVAVVEGDVADQRFVEDRVDRGAVVVAPLGVTVDLRALGRCRHAGEHPRRVSLSSRFGTGSCSAGLDFVAHRFTCPSGRFGGRTARRAYPVRARRGKPVGIRHGRATVTGERTRHEPLGRRWAREGSGERGSGSQETCPSARGPSPSREGRRAMMSPLASAASPPSCSSSSAPAGSPRPLRRRRRRRRPRPRSRSRSQRPTET